MTTIYQPHKYQVEAFNWAINANPQLVERIRDLEERYDLTIAEAGPNWQHCEFTRDDLAKTNKEIARLYQEANSQWAAGYTKGCNS